MAQLQGFDLEENELITNNNTGHIVVDSSENNNVAGVSLYYNEDDGRRGDGDTMIDGIFLNYCFLIKELLL